MKKGVEKLTGSAILIFALGYLRNPTAFAQRPVIIQPTQQTLAAAGTACTGSAQLFPVNNRNQTQHYATVAVTGAVQFSAEIDGLDTAGKVFRLSGVLEDAFTKFPFTLKCGGYFSTVRVNGYWSSNISTY